MGFAVLSRLHEQTQTRGLFSYFDGCDCLAQVKMLELPWLNNKHQISCIPAGEYTCERMNHEDYGVCFLIKDVPNRTGIIIHIGNFAAGKKKDTHGCPLPGLSFVDINLDGNIDVKDSTKAMDILRVVLPNKFQIIIR